MYSREQRTGFEGHPDTVIQSPRYTLCLEPCVVDRADDFIRDALVADVGEFLLVIVRGEIVEAERITPPKLANRISPYYVNST